MTTLLLLVLFSALAITLLDGNWRSGLLITLVIGFLQDPIRKLTIGQPGFYVGLALVAFAATVLVFYIGRNRLDLSLMLRTSPQASEWLGLFTALVLLQGVNSFARFGDPFRSMIGTAFYLAPLAGIWMGFQISRDQIFLRRFFQVYLIGSALIAVTVFLDYRGMDIPLFKEVGGGILIHFRYGFYTYGSSGLWRTSELAAWHLAASACLAFVMGFACERPSSRQPWLLLALIFAGLTLTTGRRKGLVLVLVFAGIYLLLFSRTASPRSREQVISSLLGAVGISYAAYSLFLVSATGDNFHEYVNRALTARDDIWSRFQAFALNASGAGLTASDGLGLGAGALAQTGDLHLERITGVQGNYYLASESGFGKVIAELGIPGLIILLPLIFFLGLGFYRNFRLLRLLPAGTANLELGLLAFGLANIPFFGAAAGVYGDPFILILCGLSLGSFLAVPALVLSQSAPAAPRHPYQPQWAAAAGRRS